MSTGILRKMKSQWSGPTDPVQYTLNLGEVPLALNEHLGKHLTLKHTGRFFCISCGRSIKKTFQQGYCFPCVQKLAETDACIVRPELCHHHLGTCRDDAFAQSRCFIPHSIYLANCGSAKVGITRSEQKFTRWVDQGASATIELAVVPNRLISGNCEVLLKKHISDRTNWRKMLSAEIPEVDLLALKTELTAHLNDEFRPFTVDSEVFRFTYPVIGFPSKITSHDLDKTPLLSGKLMGIKGQYLVFENTVINLRKYQGYEVEFH